MVLQSLKMRDSFVVMLVSRLRYENLEVVFEAEVGLVRLVIEKLRNLCILCAFSACKHNKGLQRNL